MRNPLGLRRVVPIMCCLLLAGASVFISGCGNSGNDSTATPISTGNTSTVHTAASGPAISDKLFFDQLTLESAPKPEKDTNGLIFLRFKYADSDGKVYECVLPKAMSEGQYSLAEWSSTFAAYRLPKVVAVKKKSSVDLGDYPFISPRPQQQQQPAANPSQPAPQVPPSAPVSLPPAGAPVAPGVGGPPP